MKKTLLALGAVSLLLGTPRASIAAHTQPALRPTIAAIELPREYIPASASMVAHLDVELLQSSALWKVFESLHGEEHMAELVAEIGFNPFDILRSITVYGSDGEPDAAVLVARQSLDDLFLKLEGEGELSYFEKDGLSLFRLDDAVGFVAHQDRNDRVLVISEDLDAVIEGARVVRGERSSLADSPDSLLRFNPVEGSFLAIAATGILSGMDAFEPASQVLGLAQGVQFDLGEAGGSLFAHLALDTGSVETARDVSDMLQGLLALGRLAIHSNEDIPSEVGLLLRALEIRSRGGVVSVDFEYSVQALVVLLETLDELDR